MNKERLEIVKQGILGDPNSYNQNYFFITVMKKGAACGTTECICGRAILEFDPRGKEIEQKFLKHEYDYESLWDKGSEILDLTPDQATRLFSEVETYSFEEAEKDGQFDEDELRDEYNAYNSEYWPFEFAYAYYKAQSGEERAKVAAARIDAFIASDGEV